MKIMNLITERTILIAIAIISLLYIGEPWIFHGQKDFYIIDYEESKDVSNIYIAFRNDDISALSNVEHESKIFNAFKQYGIKQTFSIIPNIKDRNGTPHNLKINKPIIDSLKKWEKNNFIEYALHGYYHSYEKGIGGEFANRKLKEQIERIQKGKHLLDSILGKDVTIFVPPQNQYDINTLKACVTSHIKIISAFIGTPNISETLLSANVNCTLDQHDWIPSAQKVYSIVQNSKEDTFVVIFYHSNNFDTNEDIVWLNSFLNKLQLDNRVIFTTLSDLAVKKDPACKKSIALGQMIKKINQERYYAKLYVRAINLFVDFDLYIKKKRQKVDQYYYLNDSELLKKEANGLFRIYQIIISVSRVIIVFFVVLIVGAIKYFNLNPKSIIIIISGVALVILFVKLSEYRIYEALMVLLLFLLLYKKRTYPYTDIRQNG